MKLFNNGKAIQMTYNASDVDIPEGEFEVLDDGLALFIQNKARDWGLDIKIIDNTTPKEPKDQIKLIKKEAPKETTKSNSTESTKSDSPKTKEKK